MEQRLEAIKIIDAAGHLETDPPASTSSLNIRDYPQSFGNFQNNH